MSIESAVLYINPFECEAAVDFFISLNILLQCDPFVTTNLSHSSCVKDLTGDMETVKNLWVDDKHRLCQFNIRGHKPGLLRAQSLCVHFVGLLTARD